MSKIDDYRLTLKGLTSWRTFLLKESGLPGPRGNIELAQAVAEEGDKELFLSYLAYDATKAPANTPEEFLAFCGVVGLGRLLAEGDTSVLPLIRHCASDPRWRMREGVAMALQRLGDVNMASLINAMQTWRLGNLLEQRAAAAALCEPRLLNNQDQVQEVLFILDRITENILEVADRKRDDLRALKKGLGYCWSVAVAALPEAGKPLMEKWLQYNDKDIAWIMKENMTKKRLQRMDASWVEKWKPI
jgi:HEAT repeat protein